MTQRTDRIHVDGFKKDNSTGFLIVTAKPTRAGVFKYVNPDGSVRKELRHPDEVFNSDSMNSLLHKPLTDLHPVNGRVTTKNSKSLMVGMQSGEVKRTDDDFIQTEITVTDEETIRKIESGEQVELSCGYDVDVLDEAGEFNGEQYDAIQKNIKYNHIASVPRGRAGSKARIYCDNADDAATIDFDIKLDEEEIMPTKTVIALSVAPASVGSFKADAINIEIDKELQPTIQPVLDRCDAMIAHITDLQSKLDTAQGTIDELKTKADKQISPEEMNNIAKERADVLGVAGHVGLEKFEDLSNADIKKAVVLKKNDGLNLDGKSDDYVNARYDSICEQIKQDTKGFKSLALLHAATASDNPKHAQHKDEDDDELSPRDQYMKDTKNMYHDTIGVKSDS